MFTPNLIMDGYSPEDRRSRKIIRRKAAPGEGSGRFSASHRFSVPEMAHSSENHCHLALVSGGDNLRIADRATRLDRGRCAGFRCRDQTIGKRKIRVAANGATF